VPELDAATAAQLRAELDAIEAEMARRDREKARSRWCPHSPTPQQADFLALEDPEALFGGSAGSGKSDVLLMDALRGVEYPTYAAIIFRETYADLALPGALMDRAHEWFRGTAAHWSDKAKTWTFPSGATLSFGYLEHDNDVYRYQSAEFQTACFDELTQFSERRYTYLLSRLRRTKGFPLAPHARAATNPGGRGHKWVHGRFVDERTRTAKFVPAKLGDNPHIDVEGYRAMLQKLDSTTRKQLEEGAWILDAHGLIYPLKPGNLINEAPTFGRESDWHRVLAIDLGSSQSVPSTTFTVLGWHRQIPGVFVFKAYGKAGLIPYTIAAEIRKLEGEWGGFDAIVIDDGGLGGGYLGEFQMRHAIACEAAPPKRGKRGFRKLIRGALERLEILIVAPECEALVEECESLLWDADGLEAEEGASDHQTDGLLYGWRRCIAYAAELPVPRPAPGSREAIEAEEARLEAEEEAEERDDGAGELWWQRNARS
jgi:hypothetical protein